MRRDAQEEDDPSYRERENEFNSGGDPLEMTDRNRRPKRFFRAVTALILTGSMFVLLLAGCQKQAEKAEDSSAAVEQNEAYVDQIRERGYLIVGCKMDVPDMGYYDKKTDSWSGLEVELAWKLAADIFQVSIEEAREADRVHFLGVTVADREEKLDQGEIDVMIATYTITEERKKRFAISDSYYTDYIGLMVRYSGENINSLGTSDIRSLADLDGKFIAVAKNSTTRKDMLNYIDTMNTLKVSPRFNEYSSYKAMYDALKKKEVDAMSVDVSILKGYVDSSTRILPDRFAGQHYGAAVKPENRVLLEHINNVIGQMQ